MSDPTNDATISDDDDLLRRVPKTPSFVVLDEQTGAERPATGSFRIDEDGVSVYLLSALGALPDACKRVAHRDPHRPGRCIQLSVRACRAHGMGVVRDPVDASALGRAHALILAPADVGKRRLQKHLSDIGHFCA